MVEFGTALVERVITISFLLAQVVWVLVLIPIDTLLLAVHRGVMLIDLGVVLE